MKVFGVGGLRIDTFDVSVRRPISSGKKLLLAKKNYFKKIVEML